MPTVQVTHGCGTHIRIHRSDPGDKQDVTIAVIHPCTDEVQIFYPSKADKISDEKRKAMEDMIRSNTVEVVNALTRIVMSNDTDHICISRSPTIWFDRIYIHQVNSATESNKTWSFAWDGTLLTRPQKEWVFIAKCFAIFIVLVFYLLCIEYLKFSRRGRVQACRSEEDD